jgi:hypothetical protein
MRSEICDAIRGRHLLMFGYGDAVRVVEPHIYGVNTAGHEALRAWLRPGQSRTDPDGGWRMFLVDEMRNLQVLDDVFPAPRTGYNPNDRQIPQPFCSLPGESRSDAEAQAAPESGPRAT